MIDDSHCKFWCGGLNLKSFGYDKPGATAGEFIFHSPKCPCEDCKRRYKI
jgi:hypothetical protein